MKLIRRLAPFCLALAISAPAWGDGDSDLDFLKDKPIGGDPVGPDPDATPKAFEHKSDLTPAERANIRENLKAAQANKDWLVRAYEQQLKIRSTKSADGTDTKNNLFTELGANKDLAKIAGIDNSEFAMPEVIDFHTGVDSSKHADADLRPDPALQPAPTPSQMAPRQNFYTSASFLDVARATTPFAAPSPVASTELAPLSITPNAEAGEQDAPLALRNRPTDPGAMDIPGMTAAEANPATANSPGLSAADLPGGSTRFDSALDQPLDAVAITNAEHVEKIHQTQLLAPGQEAKKAASALNQNKVLAPTATELMVPDPGSQRVHVEDPFDILR